MSGGRYPFVQLEGDAEIERIENLLPARYHIEEDDRPYTETAIVPIKNASRGCGSCVFLVGVAGKSVSCKIYTDRPNACMNFKQGEAGCLQVRERVFGKLISCTAE